MDDETLGRLYRESTSGEGDATRPTPEMLLRAVRREGSETERLATLNAALATADGRRELALLASVAAAERTAIRTRARLLRSLAAAAAVVLVATAAFFWWSTQATPAPEPYRGPAAGIELVGRSMAGDAIRLIWHATPTARRYLLEVLDSSGQVLQATHTTDTVAPLRPELVMRKGLRWWVQAETDSGPRASAIRELK